MLLILLILVLSLNAVLKRRCIAPRTRHVTRRTPLGASRFVHARDCHPRHSRHCRAARRVYGLWSMVYGLWSMVYGHTTVAAEHVREMSTPPPIHYSNARYLA